MSEAGVVQVAQDRGSVAADPGACPCASRSPLDAAIAYAAAGWPVIPLHWIVGVGCSCGDHECRSKGKHPIAGVAPRGVKDASTGITRVREWWARHPLANVGIATGAVSGSVVIDIDPRHGGDASLAAYEAEHGALPATVEASTGGGGRHIYFAFDPSVAKNRAGVLPGLDVRSDNGYVVAPPSGHVSGGRYEWVLGRAPGELPLAPLPGALRETILRRPERDRTKSTGGNRSIPEGKRNDALARIAGAMRRRGMSDEAMETALLAENEKHCVPPLAADEVRRIARNIGQYPPGRRDVETSRPFDLETEAPLVGAFLSEDLDRLRKRRDGDEKPIPTPWSMLNEALSGGLWPGCHVLTGGTGVGKTNFLLGMAVHAALAGWPVAYIGLELDRLSAVARLLGFVGSQPWSDIYLGKCAPNHFAPGQLMHLPIRILTVQPHGWDYGRLDPLAAELRRAHGKSPLIVLDFLQLVSAPEAQAHRQDLRERIARAAYAARGVAREHDAVVILVSSVARESYGAVDGNSKGRKGPALGEGNPARLVGLGKESGEIEYAADSVLTLARQSSGQAKMPPGGWTVWLAVAKLRAGIPAWIPFAFDGSEFTECPDAKPAAPDAGGGAEISSSSKPRFTRLRRNQSPPGS